MERQTTRAEKFWRAVARDPLAYRKKTGLYFQWREPGAVGFGEVGWSDGQCFFDGRFGRGCWGKLCWKRNGEVRYRFFTARRAAEVLGAMRRSIRAMHARITESVEVAEPVELPSWRETGGLKWGTALGEATGEEESPLADATLSAGKPTT